MRSLFHKVFKHEPVHEKANVGSQLHFPTAAFADSIHENQKWAMIGWIAKRMGQLLTLDPPTLSKGMNEKTEDEDSYLINLASCLFQWIEDEQDVYMEIKEMKLPGQYHKCLLEVFEENKEDIHLYIPLKHNVPVIVQTEEEEDEVWQVYHDVIYAVTQRKFRLIRESEVEKYKQGKLLCEASIKERSDIPKAREMAKQYLTDSGVSQKAIMGQLLVISEAITNILKHAEEGKMTIVQDHTENINVLVQDKGPGFPLKLLPNTVLMAGYSTKQSLGQGFTLMMKMASQVLLMTIPGEGSTIILVFNCKEEVPSGAKSPI